MAIRYVRISGNDSNAGTSAGAAWRTISFALGASGIGDGDVLYVGPGIYRENVVVNMTSATAETIVHGDVSGEFTGDPPGEVVLTNFSNGWYSAASGTTLNLNTRNFLTFRNFVLLTGLTGGSVLAAATSQNITFENCYITGWRGIPVSFRAAHNTALNLTIRRCVIWCASNSPSIQIIQTTGTTADWDLNVAIEDSLIISQGSHPVNLINSGTAANRGNGIDIKRCLLMGGLTGITITATNTTSNPSTIEDCIVIAGGTSLTGGGAGFLTDLGGNILSGAVSNVTVHATTRYSTIDSLAINMSLGHEAMFGMIPRQAYASYFSAMGARGVIGSGTVDQTNYPRPGGTGRFTDSGTATAGTTSTLTDSGKAWGIDEHRGKLVRITGGTGAGQVKHISANTATVLTISGQDSIWGTTPDNTSTYIIYEGPPVTTAKATSGSTTTFVVSGAAWPTNKWSGYTLEITAGAQNGNSRTISSNTGTTLTTAAFAGALDNTSVGSVYWPGSSLTARGGTPGAFEEHDTARRETTVTDAGGVGLHIPGPGDHEFLIPVDAASTTITVKARYDANHGTTNKPRAILKAQPEIGVSTQTVTMTSAADTWETLTFSGFTPTAKGVVTIRLESRSDTPYGRAFFDTWTVS